MPLRVENPRVSLGSQTSSGRRSRGLADIAPQYVAKSGLCTESELEGARGTSFRIQHVLGSSSVGTDGAVKFPKLDECAHFHYEHVDLGRLQISLVEEDMVKPLLAERESVKHWYIKVVSQSETWMVRRSFENFRLLDEQLHRCIYDRKFSCLPEVLNEAVGDVEDLLSNYLVKLSAIASNIINCGPVLNWLEIDNRGHRLLVPDTDTCPINTPAVAAAYTVKKYQAQAPDELSFEIGDMISVIDMPPPEESIWWRGKRGFLVGFFPCECVSVIGDKVPRHIRLNSSASEPSKSVLRKHGKLIAFFRSFILSRPSRRRLKQSGILKERVFGCDLGEHLQNSGHEIPLVLKCCAEFIETHGIVDGIYRLSGVTSNIHKLRNAFDEDRVPAIYDDDAIRQDIHSVASLLKMYFRDLPNPLCTYQLYHQFVAAVQGSHSEDLRLLKMREVVHKLPPPHYRTLEYLMRHLSRVAERGSDTGMTPRNVAIVWAPNLLRCREFEVGGVGALQFVGVQAVATEFLVRYVDIIFSDKFPSVSLSEQTSLIRKSRPKSLAISTPTKLLSLEEARNRALLNQQTDQQEYIEVGGGPASLPPRYHTVIELPRKRAGSKRSPLGWRMLFGSRGTKGAPNHQRKSSTPADFGLVREKAVTEADLQTSSSKRRLRPAKSVESLTSTGESPGVVSPPRAPQATTPLLRLPDAVNHNRSVSHDSYFDTLQDEADDQVFESSLDISEIQLNFELEDSEMRIFSEDETLIGSGSLSYGSPHPKKLSKSLPLTKRITARLARGEDSLSSSQSADPSPKKQKTQDESCGRSRLEERLSTSAGELQFIDSVSPDQIWVEAEVHPIQSPSPISSLSRMSSLLPPSSPILPHIPHLNHTRYSMPETPPPNPAPNQSRFSMPETGQSYNQLHQESLPYNQSELTTPDASYLQINSDNESTITTPDTPLCSTYTPLIESPDPPRPEERKQKPYHPYENVGPLVKTPVLETCFDVVENKRDSQGSVGRDSEDVLKSQEMSKDSSFEIPPNNRDSLGSVKYQVISTESSCDSLIDFKKMLVLTNPVPDELKSEIGEEPLEMDIVQDKEEISKTSVGCVEMASVKEPLIVEIKNCEALVSSDENLSGIASIFEETGHCADSFDSGDSLSTEKTSQIELEIKTQVEPIHWDRAFYATDQIPDHVKDELVDPERIGDSATMCSTLTNEKGQSETGLGGDAAVSELVDLLHENQQQSIQSCDPRIGDTSASSEASDWTTVIYKDQSDAVLDTESLSEDTSISSGESEKVAEVLYDIEKENVPIESSVSFSPKKEPLSLKLVEPIIQPSKEIKKPPRKMSLDVRKCVEGESADLVRGDFNKNVSRRKSSPQAGEELMVIYTDLEKSPTFRTTWRGSVDNRTLGMRQGRNSLESSPAHRSTEKTVECRANRPVGCRGGRVYLEDMDTSVAMRRSFGADFNEENKRDNPEVLRVTARLTDRGSPQSERHSAPSDMSKRSKDSLESPKKSKGVADSPSRSRDTSEWEMETPMRSNSSGNVRQLLHKFEGGEKGERPRTLERLSTKRAKESELDLSDPERRERIERYKEKRRTYLREKYRAEMEAAQRRPPFEKPPRKHPPASAAVTSGSSSSGGRRSFEAPTLSSLSRTGRRTASSPGSSNSPTSPDKQRSLDFVSESKTTPLSPERRVSSPRRKVTSPGNTTPPYCIKDMAAMFEKRDSASTNVAAQHKQYLSSV